MVHPPYHLGLHAVPTIPVARASLAIDMRGSFERVLAVLSLDGTTVAQVPPPVDDDEWTLVDVSADGTRLLLRDTARTRRSRGFCLHELATGLQYWCSTPQYEPLHFSALSPDGQEIAVMTCPPDPQDPDNDHVSLAAIDIVGVADGERRRIWATRGGIANSGIGWSPDGVLIAMSYLDQDDDTTVVVDTAGNLIGHFRRIFMAPSGSTAWLNGHELMCCDEEFELTIVDVRTGRRRQPSGGLSYPHARVDDQLLRRAPQSLDDLPVFTSVTLNDHAPRPFLMFDAPLLVSLVGRPGADRMKD
jgi:hypothetical protein